MTAGNRIVERANLVDSEEMASLTEDLATKDPIRRQTARTRLVAFGRPAVPGLVNCLQDRRRQVRWEAVKALAMIAEPTSAVALIAALDDRNEDVRWLAAVGLAAIGREGLFRVLQALTHDADRCWLLEGAHHICHALAHKQFGAVLRPVLKAIDSPEPGVAVPIAAFAALKELKQRA